MKFLFALMIFATCQSAFAREYTIYPGSTVRIGRDRVRCASEEVVRNVYCSVQPSGGLLYEATGESEQEARENLERYCISKRQAADLAKYCGEMKQIAICQR